MKTLKVILTGVLFLCMTVTSRSQEIFDAVKNNDLVKLKSLVEANPQIVNAVDESGDMPLHYAVEQGQSEMVSFLISKGADVNGSNVNRITPLHISSSSGNLEITKLLIEKGADIKVSDFRSQTPLHYAAREGYSDITAILIKNGAPLEAKNSYGRTPLLLCARERGTPEVARLLIEAGADVNAKDNFESTPLELAAWRGYKDIVNVLINNGAEIPVTGQKAGMILKSACQGGLADLFRLQVEKGIDISSPTDSQGTFLHDAAKGGSSEIVNTLIKNGLNPDSKDKYGWTPLHYAAMNNHTEVIETLLKSGVDINARTLMGMTAYNVADEFGHEKSKDMLISKGADQKPVQFPVLEGEYLGQVPPTDTPLLFAPGIISSIWGLHSSLAFSPEGDEVYWSPMVEQPGQTYSKGIIFFMKRINNKWTPPQVASFSGLTEGNDGEPFFSPDGKRIYFNSSRVNPEQDNQNKENIWYAERSDAGWSEPVPVDQIINIMSMHWQFSIDKKGNIYFASDNAGGFGMHDIYCSAFKDGKYQAPENLGAEINTKETDHTPFISPDGDYLIFCRGMELRISFRNDDGTWCESKSMGSPVNTGFELCPIITPDKKYLIFLSGREGESHPYWVSAKVVEELRPKKNN